MSEVQFKFKWPPLRDYDAGYVAGLQAFAWWKDGTQYVGTCGTTLRAAVDSYLSDNGYTKQPTASAEAQ